MRYSLAAAALIVLIAPCVTHAATSKAYGEFTLDHEYETLGEWYEEHRERVLEASNCRVIKAESDGHYLVETETPLGPCQYVVRETRSDDKDDDGRRRTLIRINFVRNVSGRVSEQRLTIALTEAGEKTDVGMWMTTTVTGRFVPTVAVKRVQTNSIAGCKAYMVKHAR